MASRLIHKAGELSLTASLRSFQGVHFRLLLALGFQSCMGCEIAMAGLPFESGIGIAGAVLA
jgi:hypothetical protein